MANELPFAVFELKEYMVIFRQSEERNFGGVVANIRGLVRCTGVGVQDDAKYQLDVFFLADYSDVPEPQVDLENKSGALFLPMSDMFTFVDVLRNEKPIYGHLRGDNPQLTSVTTTNEPIGAGDEDYEG
ncbi:MAG: hypothetical protein WBC91_21185 [Phototrophicaceae bacterium]